ncbi:uncharacterized protein LOC119674891 [Teleopsis dalmanni]|uniref:uncharacterized protein LOC119674891 n=1 Tax=Teleopsis dalmanni TaxID=139649 RepID=UPI0018CDE210|nr:uncharacterized protein LOC119674891 [Teleopsis dalmanni]
MFPNRYTDDKRLTSDQEKAIVWALSQCTSLSSSLRLTLLKTQLLNDRYNTDWSSVELSSSDSSLDTNKQEDAEAHINEKLIDCGLSNLLNTDKITNIQEVLEKNLKINCDYLKLKRSIESTHEHLKNAIENDKQRKVKQDESEMNLRFENII